MPVALAFTGGFIQSAISPTVLVTGMLELQRRGYGQDKSEPAAQPAESACAGTAVLESVMLDICCMPHMHAPDTT